MINLLKNPSLITIIIWITITNTSDLQAQPWTNDFQAETWTNDSLLTSSYSPQITAKNRHQVGLLVGRSIGATVVSENVLYEPILLMLYASFPLKKESVKRNRWYVITEPQFNLFIQDHSVKHFETGINLGLQHRWYMNPNNWFYAQISSGPHYISMHTERQAGGFIFSDNFAAGLSLKFIGQLRTEIQYRFRHLSNASIKRPNAGLNNHFLMFGLVYEW